MTEHTPYISFENLLPRPTMPRSAGSLSTAFSLPDWFTQVCDTTKSVLKVLDTFGGVHE